MHSPAIEMLPVTALRPYAGNARTYSRKQVSQIVDRGGSACLNSFGRFVKWISAAIMPPPSLVPAR